MNEHALCGIWNDLRFRRDELHDTGGAPLRVVYRGRWQHGPGPDFRGALIARPNGALIHGDVEVHLRAGDWYGHRHHLDPAFDDVILHVVLEDSGTNPARRHDGVTPPTLALAPYLAAIDDADYLAQAWRDEPCRAAWADGEREGLAAVLDRAGDERLTEHASAFEGDLVALGADEALYRGLMDAMGFAQNRRPFRALAERLPLAELASAAREADTNEGAARRLESLLLDASGLRPLSGEEQAIAGVRWRTVGIRPANHPVRRLRALATLVAGCHRQLAATLCLDWPQGSPRAVCRALRGRVTVIAPPGEPGPRHLVGPGRAADVVVNVLLPFTLAWAESHDLPSLAEAVRLAYAAHPRLAENEVTRVMTGLLAGDERRRLVKGARRQQGLIHLFKKYCDYRRCDECPAAGTNRSPAG